MVVHLKDQPHTMPLDLLKALSEQAENDVLMCTCYPQLILTRPNAPPSWQNTTTDNLKLT